MKTRRTKEKGKPDLFKYKKRHIRNNKEKKFWSHNEKRFVCLGFIAYQPL